MAFYRCIPYKYGRLDRPRTNQRCSQACSVPELEADAITKELPHTPTGNAHNH